MPRLGGVSEDEVAVPTLRRRGRFEDDAGSQLLGPQQLVVRPEIRTATVRVSPWRGVGHVIERSIEDARLLLLRVFRITQGSPKDQSYKTNEPVVGSANVAAIGSVPD